MSQKKLGAVLVVLWVLVLVLGVVFCSLAASSPEHHSPGPSSASPPARAPPHG